jgi:PAS domain S-box-containing protein
MSSSKRPARPGNRTGAPDAVQAPADAVGTLYGDLLLDAICVVDTDNYCVNASGGCERIFGYSAAEMIGKNMLDLVHPGDLERTVQSIERVMDGYQKSYFENRYVRKDGSVVSINWSAVWSEEHQVHPDGHARGGHAARHCRGAGGKPTPLTTSAGSTPGCGGCGARSNRQAAIACRWRTVRAVGFKFYQRATIRD